jgi:hypothetical protein
MLPPSFHRLTVKAVQSANAPNIECHNCYVRLVVRKQMSWFVERNTALAEQRESPATLVMV